jgi:DNA modification methylase
MVTMTIAANLLPLATPLDQLHTMPGNPRRGDVEAVARSLERFGQLKPIVARADGTVIAGNHTLMAARQLGWPELAVVRTDHDDATAKAFALADNRTSELGSYDEQALLDMLNEVNEADPTLLGAASFAATDLDDLLARLTPEPTPLADPDDVPTAAPRLTAPGDVWLLGPHRLKCGDCRNLIDVEHALDGATVNLAVTSPPYAQQRDYDESSGFKPIKPEEYVEWFEAVAANVAAHLAPDGSWLVNIKEHAEDGQRSLYVKDLTLAHVREWGWLFVDEFCWDRGGVPGKWPNRFKNGWEPVFHFTRRTSIKLRHERVASPSDGVFGYSPDNARSASGSGLVGEKVNGYHQGMALPSNVLKINTGGALTPTDHSAAFPVALPQWFVRAYTDPGDHVLDPFVGSGSTILAAHQEGRIGHGIELSPGYVDVACRRYQQATGIVPVHEATGQEHDFTADPG